VISLDTLRPDHLGAYGYERKTAPNLSGLAGEGIVYTQAYSSSSWTLPAHASLFTGRLPHQHGLTTAEFTIREDVPTITEELAAAGYRCAAFVSGYTLHSAFGFSRGFHLYDDFSCPLQTRDGLFSTGDGDGDALERVTSPIITRLAKNWLRNEKRRPFFLFLHYFDIHHHYLPPVKYRDIFDPDYHGPVDGRFTNENYPSSLSERDKERLIALYDGEIRWVDHHVGQVLGETDSLGLRDSTVIITFSDHGEGFGEHGLFTHANSLYEELVRVELTLSWPGKIPQGQECDKVVTLLQVRETLRAVARLPKADETVPSLLDVIADAERETDPTKALAICSLDTPPQTDCIRMGDWKLIVTRGTDQCQLYHLPSDPREEHNMAIEKQEIVSRLLKQLKQELHTDHEGSQIGKPKSVLPTDIIESIRALGYF